jgi:hypothetical protein
LPFILSFPSPFLIPFLLTSIPSHP